MSKTYRSQVEDLGVPVKTITIPISAGFKPLQHLFCEESIAHPAKMSIYLLYYLIKKYTKKGEVILDPMCGTGSTCIVASVLGRHGIGVDIEEKFIEWCNKSRELLIKHGKNRGEVKFIKGDARKLSQILTQSDVIITSPPYSETLSQGEGPHASSKNSPNVKHERGIYHHHKVTPLPDYNRENPHSIGNLPHGNIDVVLTSPPYSKTDPTTFTSGTMSEKIGDFRENRDRLIIQEGYSKNPKNIGNLPHGKIDTILVSPPYLNVDNVKKNSEEFWKKAKELGKRWGSKPPSGTEQKLTTSRENISNLPLGNVDAVVTSPPYSDAQIWISEKLRRDKFKGRRIFKETNDPRPKGEGNISNLPLGEVDAVITSPPYSETEMADMSECKYNTGGKTKYDLESYSEDPQNIGSLRHGKIDTIITSPPYEHQLHDSKEKRLAGAWKGGELDVEKNLPMGYSENKDNIGNMQRETYLSAMLKVYRECFKVLRSGGLALIDIKPFIRNKKVVDLPYHTYLLLRKAGFKLQEVIKYKLPTQSFWRILYYKKHSDVPRIEHAYVLVAKKPE